MFESTENEKVTISHSNFETNLLVSNRVYRPKSRKIYNIVPNQSYLRTKLTYRRITYKKSRHYNWAFQAPSDMWINGEENGLIRHYRSEFRRYVHFWRCIDYYQIHPVEIPYFDNKNGRRKYKPLALLTYSREYPTASMKPVLIDVQSDKSIKENWSWFYPAWRAANRYAKINGWNFCLIRDDFFQTPLYNNASHLLNFRNYHINSDYFTKLLENMRILQNTTIHYLLKKSSRNSDEYVAMVPQLWNLIENNYIGFNFWRPLTLNSPI
jgi:hypothetical protein